MALEWVLVVFLGVGQVMTVAPFDTRGRCEMAAERTVAILVLDGHPPVSTVCLLAQQRREAQHPRACHPSEWMRKPDAVTEWDALQ